MELLSRFSMTVLPTVPSRSQASLRADPASSRGPLIVLVVEDNPVIPLNTMAMPKDLGHQVLEANSGEQALDQVKSTVDLVITNQAMPGMTGTELCTVIKQGTPHLPIILAAGYADDDIEMDVPRLAKPFVQSELGRAIAFALNKTSTAHHQLLPAELR